MDVKFEEEDFVVEEEWEVIEVEEEERWRRRRSRSRRIRER
jgi:hypothetical protein